MANCPARHASPLAATLAQGGEFGFVLFSLAVSYGVMQRRPGADAGHRGDHLDGLHAAAASSCTAPSSSRASPRPRRAEFDPIEDDGSRVLIAGFGRVGQIIGRVLRMRHISFTALESSVAQVDFVRRFGNKVYYGDPSRLELLQAAGAARAEIFVLAMDDIDASVRTAALIKKHFPHLKVFARARNRQHAIKLMDLGVRYLSRNLLTPAWTWRKNTLEALGLIARRGAGKHPSLRCARSQDAASATPERATTNRS